MSFIVAIDGPAGAGKSTVARRVAEHLNMALVDTGAIYRCVGIQSLRQNISPEETERLGELAARLRIEFRRLNGVEGVFCEGEDVSTLIRTPDVAKAASAVASRPPVRRALLELQRRLGRDAPLGAVLEGRDIGTVVFPQANVKVFLTASAEERARRRHEELSGKGIVTTYDLVLADQIARDSEDENRAVAPLKPAADAVRVDTTGLPTDAVVDRIVALVHARKT
jgi:cytidylate kinase